MNKLKRIDTAKLEEALPRNDYENFIQIGCYKLSLRENIEKILAAMKEMKDDLHNIVEGDAIGFITDTPVAIYDAFNNTLPFLKENGGDSKIDISLGEQEDIFYLPMPNTIKDSHSQKYDETTFNLEEIMLRTTIGAGQKAISFVSDDLASTIPSVMSIAERVLKRSNLSIDPNNLMAYSGSVPRHFTFEFILNPKSKVQAEYLNEVISLLRAYSMASRNTSKYYEDLGFRTLSIESAFDFRFKTVVNNELEDIDFMNVIMASRKEDNPQGGFYLSNMTLTIGGADTLQIYYDGTPKTFNLSLTFVERVPMYSSEWSNIIIKNGMNKILNNKEGK